MTVDEGVEEFIKDIKIENEKEKIKIEYRKVLNDVIKETNRIYKNNEINIEELANSLNKKTKKELITKIICLKLQVWKYFVECYPNKKNSEIIIDF